MAQARVPGVGVTCALLLVVAASWVAADFTDAVKHVDPAVVTITAGDWSGSGFIVSSDGYIVTNRHVIEDAGDASISVKLLDEKTLPATVNANADDRDLVVLKVDATSLPVVQFASSDKLTSGQDVAAIGAPLGLEHSVTRGVVSSTSRTLDGETFIQIDAAINEGNSGGPVINEDGQVVGVVVTVADEAQSVAFAIPSTDVMRLLRSKDIPFTAALGAMPEEETEPGGDVEESTGGPEGGPEAGGEASPSDEQEEQEEQEEQDGAEPRSGFVLFRPWVFWPVIISFFVSAITALIVSLTIGRRGPSAAAVIPGQHPMPGATPFTPPPARPVDEDLSDIDIDLH